MFPQMVQPLGLMLRHSPRHASSKLECHHRLRLLFWLYLPYHACACARGHVHDHGSDERVRVRARRGCGPRCIQILFHPRDDGDVNECAQSQFPLLLHPLCGENANG